MQPFSKTHTHVNNPVHIQLRQIYLTLKVALFADGLLTT